MLLVWIAMGALTLAGAVGFYLLLLSCCYLLKRIVSLESTRESQEM